MNWPRDTKGDSSDCFLNWKWDSTCILQFPHQVPTCPSAIRTEGLSHRQRWILLAKCLGLELKQLNWPDIVPIQQICQNLPDHVLTNLGHKQSTRVMRWDSQRNTSRQCWHLSSRDHIAGRCCSLLLVSRLGLVCHRRRPFQITSSSSVEHDDRYEAGVPVEHFHKCVTEILMQLLSMPTTPEPT